MENTVNEVVVKSVKAKLTMEEKKARAVIASIKSVQKRKANMTAEELAVWRKKQSEASMKSHKARLAAMTEEQLAEFKAVRNAKAKAWRDAKKADVAVLNADAAVSALIENTVDETPAEVI